MSYHFQRKKVELCSPLEAEEGLILNYNSYNIKVYKKVIIEGSEPKYTITNDTAYPWITNTNGDLIPGNGGKKSANSTTSNYTITAQNDVIVNFQYKVSTESNYDKFTVKKGSTILVNAVSGIINYTPLEVNLSAGETLTFTYAKDSSQDKNDDLIYIKDLTFTSSIPEVWEKLENKAFLEEGDILKIEYISTNGYEMSEFSIKGLNIISSIGDEAGNITGNIVGSVVKKVQVIYKEKKLSYTQGLIFTAITGGYSVTGYNGTDTDIIIPQKYLGQDVKSIGYQAFYNKSTINSIKFDKNITSIGNYAFYGCTKLQSIYYLGSVNDWVSIQFSSQSSQPLSLHTSSILYINNAPLEDAAITVAVKAYALSGCSSLKNLILTDSVSSTATYAFTGCRNLLSAKIDSGTIGTNSFSGCINLSSVEIGDNMHTFAGSSNTGGAFSGCTSLTSITIPNSVTNIPYYTFAGCTKLNYIKLGNNVTTIGSYAFDGCSSLTSIELPQSISTIYSNAFRACPLTSVNYLGTLSKWVQISFTDIYANPVYYTKKLKIQGEELAGDIVLDSTNKINSYVLYNCELITSIQISESVTNIGTSAFYGCKDLQIVNLKSNSLVTGSNSMFNINTISTIYVPYKLLNSYKSANYWSTYKDKFVGLMEDGSIYVPVKFDSGEPGLYDDISNEMTMSWQELLDGNYFTFNNGKLSRGTYSNKTSASGKLIVSNSVTSIDETPSNYSYGTFCYFNKLTTIVLPKNITELGVYTFYGCTMLTTINIPSKISSIGKSVFYDCDSLTSITIPNSVTSIGDSAFYSSGLTTIDIPSSVTNISNNAFYACNSLTSMNYLGTLTQWEQILFGNEYSTPTYYTKKLIIQGQEIKSVVISSVSNSYGSSEAIIYQYAFYNCESLTSVTFASSVTGYCRIDDYAFAGTGITELKTPNPYSNDTNIYIEEGAFSNCKNLEIVEYNSVYGNLYKKAFDNCSKLSTIIIRNWDTPRITWDYSNWDSPFESYSNYNLLRIYVKKGTLNSYKEANGWSDYKDRIVELNSSGQIPKPSTPISIPNNLAAGLYTSSYTQVLSWQQLFDDGYLQYAKENWSGYPNAVYQVTTSDVSYHPVKNLPSNGVLMVLPSGVHCGQYMFAHQPYIKYLKVPGDAKFEWQCFGSMVALEQAFISEGVANIDQGSFWYGNKLKYISLPSTWTTWTGNGVLYLPDNPDLTTVIIKATTPPSITSQPSGAQYYPLSGITNSNFYMSDLHIYIPKGSLKNYLADSLWKVYSNYYIEIDM